MKPFPLSCVLEVCGLRSAAIVLKEQRQGSQRVLYTTKAITFKPKCRINQRRPPKKLRSWMWLCDYTQCCVAKRGFCQVGEMEWHLLVWHNHTNDSKQTDSILLGHRVQNNFFLSLLWKVVQHKLDDFLRVPAHCFCFLENSAAHFFSFYIYWTFCLRTVDSHYPTADPRSFWKIIDLTCRNRGSIRAGKHDCSIWSWVRFDHMLPFERILHFMFISMLRTLDKGQFWLVNNCLFILVTSVVTMFTSFLLVL